ncbi:MAG: hypothetical protein ACAH95_08445 [Fimbriimonas sp.]
MPGIETYGPDKIKALQRRLKIALSGSMSLQTAAQIWTNLLYAEFEGSLPLVRCYSMLPAHKLAPQYSAFAQKLAIQLGRPLVPADRVLCLMGTSGDSAAWNDCTASQGHLAIPLLSRATADSAPMIARLLLDMGVGLDWLDSGEEAVVFASLGRIASMFYVEDARTETDSAGRMVVPAQDFVRDNALRTVFGMGGAYITGSFVCTILFTKAALNRERASGFLPLINTFKSETVGHMLADRLFSV